MSTMVLHSPGARLLRLACLLLAALASVAAAQEAAAPAPPAQPKLAPNQPLYGRPETEGAMRLAPVPPPPEPIAADKLPVPPLQVPQGLPIHLFPRPLPHPPPP